MARVSWTSGAPSTEFYADIWRHAQDYGRNITTVAIRIGAINRGSSGSYSGYWGEQVATIDGIWGSAIHSGQPFLPSGVGNGAVRWDDGTWYVDIGHDGNGYRGAVFFRMRLNYDNGVRWEGGIWFDDFPRIPKPPPAPTPQGVDEISTNSVRYRFSGNGDNGTPIREWQIGYGKDPTNPTTLIGSNGLTTITGLTPATDYYIWSRGRNDMGWGAWSARTQTRTLAAARVKSLGTYRNAVPFVKVAGVWKQAQPFKKIAGIWKGAS